MKLLTKTLKKRFRKVGRQEGMDPLIIAKFFYPRSGATWYATEYDAKERIFFGYVSIFGDLNDEWGYFSFDELGSFRDKFGLGIERDLFWTEKRASLVLGKDLVPWL